MEYGSRGLVKHIVPGYVQALEDISTQLLVDVLI